MSYSVVRRLAAETQADDVPLALGMLVITGSSARLLVDSTRILTDVPCALMVTLGLYAFLRSRQGHWAWCWAGLTALVAATATRVPAAVFVPGVLSGLALDWRRPGWAKRLLATGGAAALVLGDGLLQRDDLGPPDAALRLQHLRHRCSHLIPYLRVLRHQV